MEMCYDMAFVMPKGYVSMDEEEMMYVDGGVGKSMSYSGKQGWAAAACLAGAGVTLTASAGIGTSIIMATIIPEALAGGPVGWIIGGCISAVVYCGAAFLGSQLSWAGASAAVYMKKYGRFTLTSNTELPWSLFSISK